MLGDKIKLYREKKRMTQNEVADILNVSPATISKYESGALEPNIESLKRLAELFEISIDELLSDEKEFDISKINVLDILREQKLYVNKKTYSETLNENMMMAKINFKKKYLSYKETEWREISFIWKIFYIFIDFPLTFIRELTIPLADTKNWNKTKFCLFPFCSFIFISYVFNCK